MQVAEEVLTSERPKLLVINLGQPDIAGHGGDWNAYLAALSQSDSLAAGLWRFIQGDSHLANRTILFITSDHGRHLDEVHGGFAAHGCGCEGCRRVVLWALGPGIRRGFVSDRPADLIDVTATVARLLHLDGLTLSGHVLADLFDAHVERKLRIKGSGEMIGNSGK